jgi:hypothetical protein
MKQSHLPPQPSSTLKQQILSHNLKIPVSPQEFRRLRGLARTPNDFLHLAAVCRQQADFYRLRSEQIPAAHSRQDQELATHYRELAELWTGLADECLGRADGQ